MNRITRTTIHVARTDWAPYIEQAVRAIATAAAFVYACGYVTGRWIHRLNDRLSALLVRKPAQTPEAAFREAILNTPLTEPVAPILYRCAAVPARCGIMPSTPMARAIVRVRSGMSQRQAAALCGVSRSSLQRALKG